LRVPTRTVLDRFHGLPVRVGVLERLAVAHKLFASVRVLAF
jgi:hypothetical protein